jgi:hypothetical protein
MTAKDTQILLIINKAIVQARILSIHSSTA